MESKKVCELLYQQQDPDIALRLALRRHACACAEQLGKASPGRERIAWRLYLIAALEACKQYVDERFWRDVREDVHDTMERENERGNAS